ncbi:NAD-dependent succinate-semialdehyde dehydrogenase [Nocardioides sp. AE5]|uniref:NAD-dependent succinate-semialdehyde dehydrogenase n=1 Tax=Nocardioides sp. AE5 TaxID=2962573 RepID=UPI002880D4FB|nr:NAD-dependent succinate-semialdehyde dehydrogenase [Nocardioides sp. AE5]MDT0200470.1 NAD-dependent succinate-semialdehyde dehydrogenase [Nocardioides sp. AE5]
MADTRAVDDLAFSPSALREAIAAVPKRACLGGDWVVSSAGDFEVLDPSNGQLLASVADCTPQLGEEALAIASATQQSWADTAPEFRASILRRAHALLIRRSDEFAMIIAAELGKPFAEAFGEVRYAGDYLLWFAEETRRIGGAWSISPDGSSRILTMRGPVGPTLMITPWNFPLAMIARKVAPAIAAGCTAVVKPAAETPLSALALADLLIESGLPPGVLSVLPTKHAAALVGPLMRDGRLRKVTFTGSTSVGRGLMEQASEQILRVSLELGGNAPFLVMQDADMTVAVASAMTAKLRNSGQACTAANRFLVHSSRHEEFVERFSDAMDAVVMGPAIHADAQLGPLISLREATRVHALVSQSVENGAQVTTKRRWDPEEPSRFFPPTVVDGVSAESTLMHEEVFGPVAPVITFGSVEEALTLANSTPYGLASYVMTQDQRTALHLSERLEVGLVGVNRGLVSHASAPFGGVKQSGLGREGGGEGIEEYLEVRAISVDG